MRQIAYPAAFGSCVLGAGTSAPLRAAEWSITPTYSSSVDYDSNRRLEAEGRGSDATILAVDVKFKRALEDLQLTFEPGYTFRRFTDSSLGNGDDRLVSAGLNDVGERSTVNLTASYLDQSTLTTELFETGLVSADTHRRTAQAGLTWSWSQTELRSLVTQLSFADVSYYGRFKAVFPGYRYPSGSIGEQFALGERGSFTVSAFGSRLESDTAGNSSHEAGLQAEVIYQWSEKDRVDASMGESRRQLAGRSSSGTDASLLVEHTFFLSKLSLSYKRSLVPYGFGFLVEQQQFQGTFNQPLTPFLDYSISAFRIQNNEATVLQLLDRRNYNALSVGLNWHPAETWLVGLLVQGARTETIGLDPTPVREWRSSVNVTWSPLPISRSW